MAAPNIRNGASVTTVNGRTIGVAVTNTMAAVLSNAASSNKVLKVNTVICCNVDGNAASDITLEVYDGTTGYKIASTVPVNHDTLALTLIGAQSFIYLEEGQSLRAEASANNRLQLVISYEDIS